MLNFSQKMYCKIVTQEMKRRGGWYGYDTETKDQSSQRRFRNKSKTYKTIRVNKKYTF